MPNNLITKDIDNPIVLHIVNNELDTVTDTPFATPQAAYERVAKVLATVNIPLHVPGQFEHNGGMDVFDLTQFFSDLDGEEKLFLYFEYQLEDSGLYTVFAEVVNFDDLHDLIDNYNSEKQSLNEMIAPNKHPYIQALKRPIRKDNSGMSILSHLGGTDADKHSLGTGYFGSAYHRPNKNEVVKVYNDPAYHEYAKYARDHHHEDPHLPKITSVHRIKGTQLGVARMEKLNPTSMGDKWGDSQASREPWVGKNDDFEEAVKKHPTMKATLTKAHQHMASKGHKVWADVHSGNVMKRDDGTPVLTDPFATSTEARFSHFNPTKKTLKEMIAPNKHPLIHALKNNDGYDGDAGQKIYSSLYNTPAHSNYLGAGAFGSAYARKDHVIKVYDDPGYHEFAKYARDHHHEDPHLPKIHSVQRIKGTQYGVVKMEKLHPIAKGMYSDRDSDKEDWMKGKNASIITGVKEHPTMSKTIEKIRAHLNSKGIEHNLDLHSGNIMKRDDGTPVLTDPVVSYNTLNLSVFKPGKKSLKEMTVRDVSKKLAQHGFEPHRSHGGHDVWKHKSGKGKIIPVPRHKGDLPHGTAKSILKSANIIETAPPGAKYERLVKHIKQSYASDGVLTKKEKSIAFATAWKAYKNKE